MIGATNETQGLTLEQLAIDQTIDNTTQGLWSVDIYAGNFMGIMHERNGTYEFVYRFRFYVDDVIGPETKDIFRWAKAYSYVDNISKEAFMGLIERAVAILSELHKTEVFRVLRELPGDEGTKKMTEDLLDNPNMHATTITRH